MDYFVTDSGMKVMDVGGVRVAAHCMCCSRTPVIQALRCYSLYLACLNILLLMSRWLRKVLQKISVSIKLKLEGRCCDAAIISC